MNIGRSREPKMGKGVRKKRKKKPRKKHYRDQGLNPRTQFPEPKVLIVRPRRPGQLRLSEKLLTYFEQKKARVGENSRDKNGPSSQSFRYAGIPTGFRCLDGRLKLFIHARGWL